MHYFRWNWNHKISVLSKTKLHKNILWDVITNTNDMFLLYMCVYYTYNNLKNNKNHTWCKTYLEMGRKCCRFNTTKIENVPVYVSDYNCTQAGTCENPTAKCGKVTATIF